MIEYRAVHKGRLNEVGGDGVLAGPQHQPQLPKQLPVEHSLWAHPMLVTHAMLLQCEPTAWDMQMTYWHIVIMHELMGTCFPAVPQSTQRLGYKGGGRNNTGGGGEGGGGGRDNASGAYNDCRGRRVTSMHQTLHGRELVTGSLSQVAWREHVTFARQGECHLSSLTLEVCYGACNCTGAQGVLNKQVVCQSSRDSLIRPCVQHCSSRAGWRSPVPNKGHLQHVGLSDMGV